jgi:5'-3' exonuclease
MTTLLIDGDILVYRCGFAAEHTYYTVWYDDQYAIREFDNAKECNAYMKDLREAYASGEAEGDPDCLSRTSRVEVEPVENALHIVRMLMGFQSKYPGAKMEVYFSCPTADNWRTVFFPEYKTRPTRRPEHYQAIRDFLQRRWGATVGETLEADDLIAIRAHEVEDRVIISIDKDLQQIAGLHYDWVKGEEIYVDHITADRNWAAQVLSGDATDTIPGLKGIGPVKAQKLVAEGADPMSVYQKAMGDELGSAWCELNRVLITLPFTADEWRLLQEKGANAKKAIEEIEAASEGPGVVVEGPDAGEADIPVPETQVPGAEAAR